jgi:hypothetical protein
MLVERLTHLAVYASLCAACATARTAESGKPVAREWILQIADGKGEAVLTRERLAPGLRTEEAQKKIRASLEDLVKAGPLAGSESIVVRPSHGPAFRYELRAKFANGDRYISLALLPVENGWQIADFGVFWFTVTRIAPPPHRVELRIVRSREEIAGLARRASQGDPVSGPSRVTAERGSRTSIAIFVTSYLPASNRGEELRVHVELHNPSGEQVPAGFDDLTIGEADARTLGVVVPPREIELAFDGKSPAGEWVLTVSAFDGIRKVLAESKMTLLVP